MYVKKSRKNAGLGCGSGSRLSYVSRMHTHAYIDQRWLARYNTSLQNTCGKAGKILAKCIVREKKSNSDFTRHIWDQCVTIIRNITAQVCVERARHIVGRMYNIFKFCRNETTHAHTNVCVACSVLFRRAFKTLVLTQCKSSRLIPPAEYTAWVL